MGTTQSRMSTCLRTPVKGLYQNRGMRYLWYKQACKMFNGISIPNEFANRLGLATITSI